MSFETSAYLRKATSRAKSDVANKLVSMFLHELSRKNSGALKLSVTDRPYAEDVASTFGSKCCYCARPLEEDRASVEHLDGMNRFQVGLHIPGNVIVACKRCNGEKRRDDQRHEHILAKSGWESFLSHDSTRCEASCKTCAYWRTVWTDQSDRISALSAALKRIVDFRSRYPDSLVWSRKAKGLLRKTLDTLYRECQKFATEQIEKAVQEIFSEIK